jgi:hypothetical protein
MSLTAIAAAVWLWAFSPDDGSWHRLDRYDEWRYCAAGAGESNEIAKALGYSLEYSCGNETREIER